MQSFLTKSFFAKLFLLSTSTDHLKEIYLQLTGLNYYYIDNFQIAYNHETHFTRNKVKYLRRNKNFPK